MSLHNDILDEYLSLYSSPEPPLLQEIYRDAHINLLQPRMLSGHVQGRLLKIITSLLKPQYILEIGTYTAYASLCLAEGLDKSGEVHTIEHNDEMETFIRHSIAQSDKKDQIFLHLGEAEEIIPELLKTKKFQLIYMDADKRSYSHYFDLLIDHIPSGALILADNTLWDGKVLQNPVPKDAQTQGIIAFNKKVAKDERVECVILPLRDGLSIIRKR